MIDKRKITSSSSKEHKKAKTSEPVLWLTERWNVKQLHVLASMPWIFKSDGLRDLIAEICEDVCESEDSEGYGLLKVPYKPSETLESGRIYGRGFQRVPGFVRRLCVPASYCDIDIANCFPVILRQIVEKNLNIETPILAQYLEQRDDILASDMEVLGISRSTAKTNYLRILFGGKCIVENPTPFLKSYYDEVRAIINNLWNHPNFAHVRKQVETDEGKKNKKGTFLSHVIQTIERQIVDAAMKFFRKNEIKVVTNIFDGFMVDGNVDANLHLIPCSQFVAEEVGYHVDFVEKDLKPTEEDMFMLRHPYNDHRQVNKWTLDRVTRRLRIFAKKLNDTPVKENVYRFKDECVNLFNNVMAVVLEEKGLVVVHRTEDEEKGVIFDHMDSNHDLIAKYGHLHYSIHTKDEGEDSDSKKITPIKVWLNSSRRLQYARRVMNPRPYEDTANCAKHNELNSWTGFVHQQKHSYNAEELQALEQGALKAVLDYLRDIVANGDEKVYQWLLNWLSWTIKRPWIKLPTVPILRSDDEGTGKTTVADIMKHLMGTKYYVKPSSIEDLSRTFNEHIFANTLLLVLDEAHKGHSKAQAGTFRNTVTTEEKLLERKYREGRMQRVYYNIIMMSNDKKIVQIPGSNRRFVLIETNPKFGGPYTLAAKEYFDPIYKTDWQLLFDYLCSLPNDDWNYREIPSTEATVDQVVASFDILDKFFYDMLQDPERYLDTGGQSNYSYDESEGGLIFKTWLYDQVFRQNYYTEVGARAGFQYEDVGSSGFWKRFRQTFPTAKDTRLSNSQYNNRPRAIKLPPLQTLRSDFCKKHRAEFFHHE